MNPATPTPNETQDNPQPQGEETPKNNEDTSSMYFKAEAIVTRQEEANKVTKELLERGEKLYTNQRLSGNLGGHVEVKTVSPEDKKTNDAVDFFGDSQLGRDIKKANTNG